MIVHYRYRPKRPKKPAEPVEIAVPRIVHHTRRRQAWRLPATDPDAADAPAPEPVHPVETKAPRMVHHPRRREEAWRTAQSVDPEAEARALAFLHKMIRLSTSRA